MSDPDSVAPSVRKRQELKLFLFICVLLFPILAVAVVGSYGFAVWIYQMIAGPPGPPG
ncbi:MULTISPECIES: periplasmic nitrate reductase, NapE protein [Franzmannia]|uniref:Periplasmic nitrate reductase subunit NapE n=2 Tax=Franzmannia TaxID=3137763 RepID=A0A1G9SMX8_9GAMM|nr:MULTISPECIES: periplasmic nitrate reductase, NapE protein [Halomonas]APX94467.1 periplasmic nitrate reductase, NapE protein [Halomonas sp. 1513]MDR5905360.1 periplasmic nitrate reductase, NapE protein [Halomonas qiaohouensis]SDM36799.1 periplasmic nitrate reductase subunit NapE [Halomonas pantelleriensis]